jgi:hypothetical protein
VEAASLLDEHGKLEVSNLIRLQPACGQGRRVNKQEKAGNAEDNGGKAFKDEDPSPALVSTNSVHLSDTGSEQARESAREGTCAVEV